MKDIVIMHQNKTSGWYKPWNKRSFAINFAGLILIAIFISLFTIFFDIVWIKIGYIFMYFVMIFLMAITYFFYSFVKTKFIGLFFFGINGIIGIPIEYFVEWQIEGTLNSPLGAIYWALIYIGYGLSIDLSLMLLNPQKNESRAFLLSSLVSSVCFIILSVIALTSFYRSGLAIPGIDDFLTYSYFMIPYSIVQGVMGSYIGWNLGNHMLYGNTTRGELSKVVIS